MVLLGEAYDDGPGIDKNLRERLVMPARSGQAAR